jgi:hypothetical protein
MAKYPYVARGSQANRIYTTQIFNIDNGAATTIDDCAFSLDQPVEIISIRAIYTEATDTAGVASANYKVGTTAGGAEIVAAFALEVSKAVGAAGTKATLVSDYVPANTTVFVRHTGIAATEAGQYKVQIEYRVRP